MRKLPFKSEIIFRFAREEEGEASGWQPREDQAPERHTVIRRRKILMEISIKSDRMERNERAPMEGKN